MRRFIKNSLKSKVDIDQPYSVKQKITRTARPLPTDPLKSVVNVSELFNTERDLGICYRFSGTINILSSNVLFNWSGENSYQDVITNRDFDADTGEYVLDDSDTLFEEDGWFYYLTGSTGCEKQFLEPQPNRFKMLNNLAQKNWNVWITYPAEVDITPLEFNEVNINNGISIFSGTTITVDDRTMTAFICSINHGLAVGDQIVIDGVTSTGYEGTYEVFKLGLENNTYKGNIFVVDINNGVPPSFIGTKTRFKKRTEGVFSRYYGRWFKKISKLSDFTEHKTAFAQNIYSDQIYSYILNRDFEFSDEVLDYLGRPLTEVYLTVVKKQDYQESSPFWTRVQSGVKATLMYSDYDIQRINTTNYNLSIEDDVNNNSDLIFGDIVEYNPISQEEIVLEVAYHRFNTKNREENNFLEGYYYAPHKKKQIREFSNYINLDFTGSSDVPFFAEKLDDGRAIWRDILPNSSINSTNIPFLNNCHYIHDTNNLYIRRQDPCNLYLMGNDSIIGGICDTEEQFEEEVIVNICE